MAGLGRQTTPAIIAITLTKDGGNLQGNLQNVLDSFKNGSHGDCEDEPLPPACNLEDATHVISSIFNGVTKFTAAVLLSKIVDPLIIDTAGDGIKLDSFATSNALFDLNGDGIKENTGWTRANSDDTFLVIDKNSNGNIDDISEMFGNQTIAGFTDLKSYDSMPLPRLVRGIGAVVKVAANDNCIDCGIYRLNIA